MQGQHFQAGGEAFELLLPVADEGLGADDQRGAGRGGTVLDQTDERDGLQGFAQAHVIGQKARLRTACGGFQPADAFHLVRPQQGSKIGQALLHPGLALEAGGLAGAEFDVIAGEQELRFVGPHLDTSGGEGAVEVAQVLFEFLAGLLINDVALAFLGDALAAAADHLQHVEAADAEAVGGLIGDVE